MWRLGKLLPSFLLTLLLSGLFAFLTFTVSSVHTAASNAQGQNCSSTCTSHAQPAALGSQKENKDDDDKEPIPPIAYWQQQEIDLANLYVVPILALVPLSILFRKHLLSTQLRL